MMHYEREYRADWTYQGSLIPDKLKTIIRHYTKMGYSMDITFVCDSLHTNLIINSITAIAMISSLIAQLWARPQTQ